MKYNEHQKEKLLKMANEQDNYKINFDTNAKKAAQDTNALANSLDNVEESTQRVNTQNKSLKAQIKEATVELIKAQQKFGDYSKEALAAAKNVAILKDKMAEASETANLFDPGKKFQAVAGAVTAMASGFAVAQGAMGLFGAESEEVEKTLLKVQSAMALSQGLQSIGESVDSFKQLGAVVKSYAIVQKVSTAAQWLWNAAMTANPLGAIVLAITAVIAAGYGLIKFFGTVEISSKKAMIGIQENAKALQDSERITKKHNEALKDSANYQYEMAKASGASAKELQAISIKQADADISLKTLNRTIAQNTYYRELNSLAILKNSGATEEAIKMQDELVKKALENFSSENKALTASLRDKKLIIQKGNVDERQAKTDHFEKLNADKKADNEKAIELEKENQKKYAEETKTGLQILNQAVLDNEAQIKLNKSNLKDEQLAILQEGIDAEQEIENTGNANKKLSSDERINIAKAEAQQKKDIQDAEFALASGAVEFLKQIGGKNKTIQKAAIIAENAIGIGKMIIANNAANIGALATPQAILTSGASAVPVIAMNNITTALGIATTIASTAKALSAVGGGSAGSAPSGGGSMGGAPSPPSFNIVGASGTNQIAQAIGGQQAQPVQAYVVAGAVTTGQSLNRNIIANASMG